jgi:hypothetical protein
MVTSAPAPETPVQRYTVIEILLGWTSWDFMQRQTRIIKLCN